MWEKTDKGMVWITRKESLMRRTKEELIDILLDLENELRERDEQ